MLYIIYDTALNGVYTLPILQKNYPVNFSLFKGTKDEILIDVAPYLFCVDDDFLNKVNEPYTSLKHLIAIETNTKIEDLLGHLQQFIYQKESGNEYYFRFWDARVLARFLPTCNYNSLNNFFGETTAFYALNEEHVEATKYQLKNSKLITSKIVLNSVFANASSKREDSKTENLVEQGYDKLSTSKRTFFS